jgi:serine protease Do
MPQMKNLLRGTLAASVLLWHPGSARAAEARAFQSAAVLSDSLQSMVRQVSPSIVQVEVTGFGPLEQSDATQTDLVISKQRSMGSGVVVDQSGYILTNEHVVTGARRVMVVLPSAATDGASAQDAGGRRFEAEVVGTTREMDLALLKIDAAGLQPLPLGDSTALRQGELVFAFGSPEGFRNSVSMGVVSAVSRQPDPDSPLTYIQTDAAVNHGNSGGPLVNARGEMVGLNTFIYSKSGGSEGLSFALPGALINVIYPKLREFGELHRAETGMLLQPMSPALAKGLRLSSDRGLIVADVTDGKPASLAGLQIGDVIDTVDGQPVDSVPAFAMRMLALNGGEHVKIGGVRGSRSFMVDVTVAPHVEKATRVTDFIDPNGGVVAALGIVGVDITLEVAELMPSLRAASGVVVAAHAAAPGIDDVQLAMGDVIHSVNGNLVSAVEDLRKDLQNIRPGQPVVLQIERGGQLSFLTFEAE